MMKEKLKRKSFWLTVVGAVILVLQFCGIKIDLPYANEIAGAICALMIFLGVMTDDTQKTEEDIMIDNENENTLETNGKRTEEDYEE